jgi:threonine/homoserine/homoserine lactone efflux protein
MQSGRKRGLAIAMGITTGSWIWSIGAALGLSALMVSYGWAFEAMRYIGAGYLLFLAFKSAKSAMRSEAIITKGLVIDSSRVAYLKGLGLHLTNPKAILFFGSLYAVGMPASAAVSDLILVMVCIGIQSAIIFCFYAVLFSTAGMMTQYTKLRRWFEGVFAVMFGLAGLKILTTRLQ